MDIYPNSPTHTEELIDLIEKNAPGENKDPNTEIIMQLISKHDPSLMLEGVRYYLNESDITNRQQYYWRDGKKIIDSEGVKPNNKIPHGWHKLLVDQKTQYLVGKPITFGSKNKTLLKYVNELADEEFDDTMNELVKNASNKGIEWLHPFINEEGEFDYVIFPAEEIIAVYDNTKSRRLLYAIRYYKIEDFEGNEQKKVELYTTDKVYYYVEENGGLVLDYSYGEENPVSYFYTVNKEENTKEGYGWGRVPLIPFRNNTESVSDLTFYKRLIDNYDKIVSDNANSFDEIQELIYILRGYNGEDLSEFVDNLRYYRAVKVDGEGSGVDTLSSDVPIDSADKHLDRLEDNIFRFGQGVNNSPDKFGNSPSGVALENLYTLLDLKANAAERKFRKALQEFFWFFTEFLRIKKMGDFNYKEIQMTFNRTKITNQLEKVQMVNQSPDVSRETRLAHHPFVDDVEAELERIEDETAEYGKTLSSLAAADDQSEDEEGGEEDEPE
ncbi:phage portal protein [Bacillus licheniformis]|uniref:phage portal protein n=1 Tax=Bacillus licheniformis TaxID=1402 RepID=UPI001376863B|nr:phage portal protein [Bacillus licheniformis]